MSNPKSLKFAARRSSLGLCVRNIRVHPLLDAPDQSVQFVGISFGHKLDPAVGQITYVAHNGQVSGHRCGGVSKPNSLNAAGKVNFVSHGEVESGEWRVGCHSHFPLSTSYKKNPAPGWLTLVGVSQINLVLAGEPAVLESSP